MGYNKFRKQMGINPSIHTMTIPNSAEVPQQKSVIMCVTELFIISKSYNN